MEHAASFGETLRRFREMSGLSLRGLAKRISYSPGWLSRIENGLARPTPQMARLCDRELAAAGALVAAAWYQRADRDRGPTPAQLPRETAGFVGRAPELALLDGLPDGVLVSVEGAAGIGKTALTLRWAHQAAGRFPDGVLYADLHGFSPTTDPLPPAEALAGFLLTLGVAPGDLPSTVPQRTALWRTLSAHRRMLVVLDNAVDARQVEPLLPGSASCAVAVTSRRRLTGLVVRHQAVTLPLGPLPPAEAVALLGSFGGFLPAEAAGLAARCGRVPLALRIAGARLAAGAGPLTAPGSGLLDFLSPTGEDTPSVRAALARSYRELSASAARLLRAGLAGPDRHALEQLLDLHLVARTEEGYRLDELTAAFAAELPAPVREGRAGGAVAAR